MARERFQQHRSGVLVSAETPRQGTDRLHWSACSSPGNQERVMGQAQMVTVDYPLGKEPFCCCPHLLEPQRTPSWACNNGSFSVMRMAASGEKHLVATTGLLIAPGDLLRRQKELFVPASSCRQLRELHQRSGIIQWTNLFAFPQSAPRSPNIRLSISEMN